MEADKFGKTEGRLYRYFENIKRIASLNEQNVELDKRYDHVDEILRTSNFNFDISIGSIGLRKEYKLHALVKV